MVKITREDERGDVIAQVSGCCIGAEIKGEMMNNKERMGTGCGEGVQVVKEGGCTA